MRKLGISKFKRNQGIDPRSKSTLVKHKEVKQQSTDEAKDKLAFIREIRKQRTKKSPK